MTTGKPIRAAILRASAAERAMPFSGWRSFSFLQQLGEAVAILGEIDGIGRGAEDRHAGAFERVGEIERRLAAELDDDAFERVRSTARQR